VLEPRGHRFRSGRNLSGVKSLFAVAAVLVGCAAVVAPAQAATEVKQYRAWDSNGDPRVDSWNDYRGDCSTESFKSSRDDAWRCFVGGQILDPCFANPFSDGEVLCVQSPWAHEGALVRTKLDEANHGARPGGRPWTVVLASGKRCGFLSGGTAVGPGGHRLNYGCGRSPHAGFLFGIPNRTRPTWTIRFARSVDSPTYRRVKIRTAWR
jgi:hypothetical protein